MDQDPLENTSGLTASQSSLEAGLVPPAVQSHLLLQAPDALQLLLLGAVGSV